MANSSFKKRLRPRPGVELTTQPDAKTRQVVVSSPAEDADGVQQSAAEACASRFAEVNIEALCAAPPETHVHSPSQTPLSCPIAPQSKRELHKDGDGGGGGVARRARPARAPKAKRCATSCGTSSATSCAAYFACLFFMCHLRTGVWGGLASGSPHAAALLFFAP